MDSDGDASVYDNNTNYDSDDNIPFSQTTGDWRKTHEDLLHNIRKAKRAATKSANRRQGSAKSSSTARENRDEGLGTCC